MRHSWYIAGAVYNEHGYWPIRWVCRQCGCKKSTDSGSMDRVKYKPAGYGHRAPKCFGSSDVTLPAMRIKATFDHDPDDSVWRPASAAEVESTLESVRERNRAKSKRRRAKSRRRRASLTRGL